MMRVLLVPAVGVDPELDLPDDFVSVPETLRYGAKVGLGDHRRFPLLRVEEVILTPEGPADAIVTVYPPADLYPDKRPKRSGWWRPYRDISSVA
jgi:hypothetical protein